MWCSFESSSHNCFSADDSSSDDSASSDASEYCPSHEDETSDESAELLSTEESEFGCQDSPDYCPTHQHQCKTVVSSVQSSSSSGTLSVSFVEGRESQEVARSAPKKRKIPVGIILPNQVSFMELSQLETFVDSINKIRGCKTSKCDVSVWVEAFIFVLVAMVVDPNRQFLKPIPSTNLAKGQITLASVYK